jgi:CheY-like chemotaxis protein
MAIISQLKLSDIEQYSLARPLDRPIFIVDDSEDDRLMLRSRIVAASDQSLPVKSFGGGKDLLTCLKSVEQSAGNNQSSLAHVPHLIFLDLIMPDMDGIETLRAIRACPFWAGVPVALVTNSTNETYIRRATDFGANVLCRKPVTKGEIKLILDKLVFSSAVRSV